MTTTNRLNILHIIAYICMFFSQSVFANENTNPVADEYRELCVIYKSIVNKSIDLSIKEMEITENVQNKLPKLFDRLFVHVIVTDAADRYALIKQYAKQQDKLAWECEAAHQYYTTAFVEH